MKTRGFVALVLSACISGLLGCKDQTVIAAETAGSARGQATENIDAGERAAAAQLRPARDPIMDQIQQFRVQMRQLYNNRAFDELEKHVAELRASKEVFGNGSWKIVQYYFAFPCSSDEPENMWQLHEQIHKEWIAGKPQSIAARVAYADFLVDYAWKARGNGYADTVTEAGWRTFSERMAAAQNVLDEGRKLKEKDPYWWLVALKIARGAQWPKAQYEALITEAKSFEPKFWGYDTERAFSLLPRWYGHPGDWEAYAEKESARPDGLGAETYARIAIYLRGFHDNLFRESKASWPKIREGLEQMRKKYPDSLEVLSNTAMLATMAQDRELAKAAFDQLGDRYMPSVWRRPERFVHYRTWAQTGRW